VADVFSKHKRSEVMARIRGSNTGPERLVRSLLHRLGYRFTVNGPNNRKLPGKPDIVLPRFRTVVFVHGCFWHGHEGCKDFTIPRTRRAWWTAKIASNKRRDAANEERLRWLGWQVVTIWGCATKTIDARAWLAARLPTLIGPPPLRQRRCYPIDADPPALRAADTTPDD
jgi:DNA mismatch endonuclease (patch repair protein)